MADVSSDKISISLKNLSTIERVSYDPEVITGNVNREKCRQQQMAVFCLANVEIQMLSWPRSDSRVVISPVLIESISNSAFLFENKRIQRNERIRVQLLAGVSQLRKFEIDPKWQST